MAVNYDSLLEIITQASNALGRAKDALLKEKERADKPAEEERLTAAQWAARDAAINAEVRQSRADVRNDLRIAATVADTPPETKSTPKASNKSS